VFINFSQLKIASLNVKGDLKFLHALKVSKVV